MDEAYSKTKYTISQPLIKKGNQIIVQVVLPLTMRKTIVKEYHDQPTAGHLAYLCTFLNIQKRYYWPDMSTEIKEYCKARVTCQETKKLSYSVRPLLHPIDVAPSQEILSAQCR